MTSWEEHEAGLTAHDIADLRFHWSEAYKITWSDRRFKAERLDGLGSFEAANRAELRRMILDDYLDRPVPRGETAMGGESPQQLDQCPTADDVPTLPLVSGSTQAVPAEERLRRVDALDLEPIVYKLMHPEPGETNLTLARADQDVVLYRCFLKLCVMYPDATIVPTRQLDHVWHTHMLDTAKYRADCDWAFGFFIDHFPYFGFRGEGDWRAWREDFAHTRRLFEAHFSVDIGGQPAASACRNHGGVSGCCVGCIKPADIESRPRPDRGQLITRTGLRDLTSNEPGRAAGRAAPGGGGRFSEAGSEVRL
jgi:hypothetical protein